MTHFTRLRYEISRFAGDQGLTVVDCNLQELQIRLWKRKLKPETPHNPLPELGIENVLLNDGSWPRWAVIKRSMNGNIGSALDVGCSNGFLSLRLAGAGFVVLGIDQDATSIRTANLAVQTSGLDGVSFMRLKLNPESVDRLPQADYVLFLSAFQQWVVSFSFPVAMDMLESLWKRTRLALFFETAESYSCKAEYAGYLPFMGQTPESCRRYVANMLGGLEAAQVSCLGYFPTDYRAEESRHLFLVQRIPERGQT